MENTNLGNKMKEIIRQWRGEVEHLNVQLNLGMKEARDEFETQKKVLHDWVVKSEEALSKLLDKNEEKLENVRAKLDHLKVQAALGKAETRDEIHHQRKQINSALHDLKLELNTFLGSSKDVVDDFIHSAEDTLEKVHTRMDLLHLKMYLGKKEAEKEWDSKKKELNKHLHDLHHRIDEMAEESEEKWDHFSGEMKEAWSHFRKALQV